MEKSMRLEEIGNEFPKMPEEMRMMVEREVEKQIRKGVRQRSRMSKRSMAVLVLAATMALGMTVFAGVKVYQMRQNPVGNYGVSVTVDKTEEQAPGTEAENFVVPQVELTVGYLPEGMVETEKQKYSYENNLYRGGISMYFYGMDTGDDAFEVLDKNVTKSEEIQVGGYDGVYLEFGNADGADAGFTKKLYVDYHDVHYVMEMFVGEDVTKEEALKIAEGVQLTPAAGDSDAVVKDWYWSERLAAEQEEAEKAASGEDAFSVKLTASEKEMEHLHQIGEEFPMETFVGDDWETVTMTVKEVSVYDNVSMLDMAYCDEDFLAEETDENGILKDTTIDFVREGDGVERMNEVVDSKTTGQRLVYLTLAYTNHGNEDMKNVLFCPSMMKLEKEGENYQIFGNGLPGTGGADWDYARDNSRLMKGGEMSYYDVRGGESGNNYIPEIKAKETVEVHVGYFVNEEELPYLYLNPRGGSSEFYEEDLATGLVDIRQ